MLGIVWSFEPDKYKKNPIFKQISSKSKRLLIYATLVTQTQCYQKTNTEKNKVAVVFFF